MKRSMLVSGLVIFAICVAPAVAQQSLGDVAGSIKLKRPEGESVVIDRDTIGQTRRSQPGVTDGDAFLAAVEDCLTETRAFNALVMETRNGSSFYRDEWRDRVAEAGLSLDGAIQELGIVSAEGRYQEAYDFAGQGSANAAAALEILRNAIADDRPVYSQAGALSKEAIRLFGEAQSSIGKASRANAAEDAPLPINPIDADRVISALCGSQYGAGSSGYASCVDQQKAAVDSMAVRFAPGVGLDSASFNVIRNNCRFEWPNNYVSQDRCERNRSAAKTMQ